MTDFYKCNACQKLVKVITEGKGELSCCGSPMKMLSGFGSINEILDFAIEKEQEASQFYTDWAKKLPSPNLRGMFERFAQEELKHKEADLGTEGQHLPALGQQVTDSKIVDYRSIHALPQHGYQEALIIAMEREKASSDYGSDLATVAGAESLQLLFTALTQEEAKHRLWLETDMKMKYIRN